MLPRIDRGAIIDPVSPLRLGIVGCGRITELVHLQALTRVAGIEVRAAADPAPERLRIVQARFPEARLLATQAELLALDDVDAVLLTLPSGDHAEAACAAFAAKKHVYLEKPIATRVSDGERVVAAWDSAGTIGMIGFNYRFDPRHVALRARLGAGDIGEPIAIRTSFSSPLRDLPAWKRERALGGGVLLDLASHHIDRVRHVTGREILGVTAHLRSRHSQDDTALLALELEDDLLVQSFFSMCAVEEDRFEVYGSRGKLVVDRAQAGPIASPVQRPGGRGGRLAAELRGPGGVPARLLGALRSGWEPSFDAALSAFAQAAARGTAAAPDLRDGLASLRVIEAAEESARSGTTVSLR